MLHKRLEQCKCAIFDLDGTLLDSTGVWEQIDIDFLGKRGIAVPADYMEEIRHHNFQTGSLYVKERFGIPDEPTAIANEWLSMAREKYHKEVRLKPYVKEFLAQLKQQGMKIATATSSSYELYAPCLKRNGVYDCFDTFTETHEVTRSKGYPDVYELAAGRCGAQTKDCVVFEDILKAVQGAKMGNFFTIGVADKASEHERAQIEATADMYIQDYRELFTEE